MARALLSLPLVLCLVPSSSCIENAVPVPITQLSFCQDNARIRCRVLFECFGANERAKALAELGVTWSSQAECLSDQLGRCEAMPMACNPGQIFQEQKAAACINARRALNCADWLNPRRTEPAACVTCEMISPEECVGHRISYCTGEASP